MNLLQIRKNLIDFSGRFDLVKDLSSYEDNGANFFIQAGQRLLDGMLSTPNEEKEFHINLSPGDFSKVLTEVRAVRKVHMFKGGDLKRISVSEMYERYGGFEITGDTPRGTPIEYALGTRRRDVDDPVNHSGIRLLINPPTDKPELLVITALYLSEKLTNNTDESWWSVNHPDLLIQAALYKAEVFLRNTQGANDWLSQIEYAVTMIDSDRVEQAIAEVDQMKNSWNFRTHLPTRHR